MDAKGGYSSGDRQVGDLAPPPRGPALSGPVTGTYTVSLRGEAEGALRRAMERTGASYTEVIERALLVAQYVDLADARPGMVIHPPEGEPRRRPWFGGYTPERRDSAPEAILPPLHGGYRPRADGRRPTIDPPTPPTGRGGGS